MTQKDKELLLKDLCPRLSYGIFVKDEVDDKAIYTIDYHPHLRNCKPYLRSMSSMTEEEVEEFYDFTDKLFEYKASEKIWGEIVDWMNEHYFDYRGLIDKGLALEAPKGMYKYV